MEKYIFLITALPELSLEEPPRLSSSDLLVLCEENLSPSDLSQVNHILEYLDIQNLYAYLSQEKLNPRARLNTQRSIEEALEFKAFFPEYVLEFLDEFEKTSERIKYFPRLFPLYFKSYQEETQGFLNSYLAFEREWRLVMLGFRTKKQQRELTHELRYEEEGDPFVMQILAQKDAQHYEPPYEYTDLKPLFESYQNQPLELEKYLIAYRLQVIEYLVENEYFTINKVLSYLVSLISIEEWHELNNQKGIEIVETMIKEIS